MIDPTFLAGLRHRYRAELVLVLVQLEQLCPGWWMTIDQLAQQLGTDRSTLTRNLRKLDRYKLIRRTSFSNSGGTWIWWVQRNADDAPRAEDEPAWVVRSVQTRHLYRIPISQKWQWAERHKVERNTMRSFLAGGQTTMQGHWQLVATPHD